MHKLLSKNTSIKLSNTYNLNITGARSLLAKPGQNKDDIGLVRTMIAGAAGGLILWTVIFPADVVKSRIQVSNLNASFTAITLKICRTEGKQTN